MSQDHKGTFVPYDQADCLWKDNILRIVRNQFTIWPARWGFLVDEYEKMYEVLEGKRELSPCDSRRPIPLKRTKATTRLPPIHPKPANLQLPRTSSAWYGYMHQKDGHNLVSDRQKWTKSTVVQHDLIKVLKWPMDHYD